MSTSTKRIQKAASLALACFMCMALSLGTAQPALAELTAGSPDELDTMTISYLPDVTEPMTHASYWSSKQENPTAVLADRNAIDQLNQDGIDADDTWLQPLKSARDYFFSEDQQRDLKAAAESDLAYFISEGARDINGNLLTAEGAAAIANNCPTDGSVPTNASGQPLTSAFAVVITHTTMRGLPTDQMMGLTPGDKDDDNLYLSALRVNEPLVIRAQSVDKKFFLCISSCMNVAWVPAEDIALCANRDQWLSAWDIPAGKELVVTGYKVRTEQTRQTPNVANRMLYMGTVLERVDLESPEQALEIVGTSSAFNRHVCYLPVRDATTGAYSKELALIAESADVSEGFLPLTTEGIANTAFKSLGQMYGWGGMLEANDCSGYVRDVYKCFGLELARNTTWQMNLPVRKYSFAGLDADHKAAAIAQMPLGTVLFWGSHEMIYLGQENGKLYVIGAVGLVGDLYGDSSSSYQVKDVIVHTLDTLRPNRVTFLDMLTTANIPYIPASEAGPDITDIAFYANSVAWPNSSYEYTGKAIEPSVTIPGLIAGTDYQVSFSNNVKPGTATITISGAGNYSGSISRTFKITPKTAPAPATNMMLRLYNPYSGEHLYTANAAERNALVKAGWRYEGVSWTAPSKSAIPVYRLYNKYEPMGDHHYTADRGEYDNLVNAGWAGEGTAWYSDEGKGTALLRLFNPYAYSEGHSGAHHYTSNMAEFNNLVSLGWKAEGIAWYGK